MAAVAIPTTTVATATHRGYLAIRRCSSLRSPAVFCQWEDGRQFLSSADDEYRLCASLTDAVTYIGLDDAASTTTAPADTKPNTVTPISAAPCDEIALPTPRMHGCGTPTTDACSDSVAVSEDATRSLRQSPQHKGSTDTTESSPTAAEDPSASTQPHPQLRNVPTVLRTAATVATAATAAVDTSADQTANGSRHTHRAQPFVTNDCYATGAATHSNHDRTYTYTDIVVDISKAHLFAGMKRSFDEDHDDGDISDCRPLRPTFHSDSSYETCRNSTYNCSDSVSDSSRATTISTVVPASSAHSVKSRTSKSKSPASPAATGRTRRGPKPFQGKSFDEMFAELEQYKRQHGDVNVPSHPKTPLLNWIKAVRKDYNTNFKHGRVAYLNSKRIHRLTKIGFNFHPKRFTAFEESAMKWLEYKTKHGQDPPSSSALGSWVRYTRKAHKNLMDKRRGLDNETSSSSVSSKKTGRPANLTAEWIARLTSWGFVWQIAEQPKRQSVPKRPWDERFEQLLEYKRTHGDTLVPQKYPVLGTWVHCQRSEYKKFMDGKKARITKERIAKLVDAGFVFDTRARRVCASPTQAASTEIVPMDQEPTVPEVCHVQHQDPCQKSRPLRQPAVYRARDGIAPSMATATPVATAVNSSSLHLQQPQFHIQQRRQQEEEHQFIDVFEGAHCNSHSIGLIDCDASIECSEPDMIADSFSDHEASEPAAVFASWGK